jgi:hypothetical protein
VLYPYRAGETAPAFVAWGGGAGVTATVAGEKQTAICAAEPGSFSEGGVAFDGQRALVREGNGRLVLALLAGKRLEAGGCTVRADGPVSITLADGRVGGESGLPQPGEAMLTLPAATPAAAAMIIGAGKESRVALTRDGQTVRLPLPAGRCTFRLE